MRIVIDRFADTYYAGCNYTESSDLRFEKKITIHRIAIFEVSTKRISMLQVTIQRNCYHAVMQISIARNGI